MSDDTVTPVVETVVADPALPPKDEKGNYVVGSGKDTPEYRELQKNYKELQATYTKGQQEKALAEKGEQVDAKPEQEKAVDPSTLDDLKLKPSKEGDETDVKEKVSDKDIPLFKTEDGLLDLDKIEGLILENNGELPKPVVLSLAKHHGISEELAANYLAGQESLGREAAATLYESAGGKEKWDKVQEWASVPGNMLPADLEAFNASLDSSKSIEHAKLAMAGLTANYDAAQGLAGLPRPLGGDGVAPSGGADVYASKEEAYAAQSDKRYLSGKPEDMAYQQDVQARLLRSPQF